MKKTFVAMIIIAIMLVGGLTFIGFHLSRANKEYYDLEKVLESSASRYFGQYPGSLPARSLIITASELIDAEFLEDFKVGCSGYVEVSKSGSFYNYKAFINCPNYITRKYDANNDREIIVPYSEES